MIAPPRRIIAITAAVLALLAVPVGLSACGGSAAGVVTGASSSPVAKDPVLANVNGRDVHQGDVDTVRAEARFDKHPVSAAKALDEAISRELVRQEAERLGVKADPAEVASRVAQLTKQVGGEQALLKLLKSVDMTKQQLTDALTYGVLREAVQDALYPGITASEAALHRFYRQNRGTLFTEPASVHLEAVVVRNQGIASNALKRIKDGQDFRLVSRQFTVDPELQAADGDMGWVLEESLPTPLQTAVVKLKVGYVSKPVQGPGGWYIFKIAARRSQHVVPFSQVHDELAKELTRRARSAALDKWLRQARSKADITKP